MNKQLKKNTNNPKKQTKLLQRKKKGLVADYRNVNAIIELNFQGMAHPKKIILSFKSYESQWERRTCSAPYGRQ